MQKTVTEDETRPCPYLFLAVHSPSASLALLGDPERGELVLARDHPNCPPTTVSNLARSPLSGSLECTSRGGRCLLPDVANWSPSVWSLH